MASRWLLYKSPYFLGGELRISFYFSYASIASGDKLRFVLRDSHVAVSDSSDLSDVVYSVDFNSADVLPGNSRLEFRIDGTATWKLFKNSDATPFLTGPVNDVVLSGALPYFPAIIHESSGFPGTTLVLSTVNFSVGAPPVLPETTWVSFLPNQGLAEYLKSAARNNIAAFGQDEIQDVIDDINTTTDQNFVAFTHPQELNGTQRIQARTNIDAASKADVTGLQERIDANTTDIDTLNGEVGTNTANIATNTTNITTLQGQMEPIANIRPVRGHLTGAGGTATYLTGNNPGLFFSGVNKNTGETSFIYAGTPAPTGVSGITLPNEDGSNTIDGCEISITIDVNFPIPVTFHRRINNVTQSSIHTLHAGDNVIFSRHGGSWKTLSVTKASTVDANAGRIAGLNTEFLSATSAQSFTSGGLSLVRANGKLAGIPDGPSGYIPFVDTNRMLNSACSLGELKSLVAEAARKATAPIPVPYALYLNGIRYVITDNKNGAPYWSREGSPVEQIRRAATTAGWEITDSSNFVIDTSIVGWPTLPADAFFTGGSFVSYSPQLEPAAALNEAMLFENMNTIPALPRFFKGTLSGFLPGIDAGGFNQVVLTVTADASYLEQVKAGDYVEIAFTDNTLVPDGLYIRYPMTCQSDGVVTVSLSSTDSEATTLSEIPLIVKFTKTRF